jgi:hypothetical protein
LDEFEGRAGNGSGERTKTTVNIGRRDGEMSWGQTRRNGDGESEWKGNIKVECHEKFMEGV